MVQRLFSKRFFLSFLTSLFSCFFLLFNVFGEWIYFENHLHSTDSHLFSRLPTYTSYSRSYDPKGIQTLKDLARNSGIQGIAITDHNTISHWFDPVFSSSTDLILLRAMEWTNMFGGHATLIAFDAKDQAEAIVPPHPAGRVGEKDYQEMMEEVHRRNGLVIINHPKSFYFFHQWPDNIYDADGIELNFLSWMHPQETIEWWQEELRQGKKLLLLGGSDYHVGGKTVSLPFQSLNLVWVKERTEEALLDALRKGRVQVIKQKESLAVLKGMFVIKESSTYEMGDSVLLSPLQSILLQLQVSRGKGRRLMVYSRSSSFEVENIESDDFSWGTVYRPQAPFDFLRLELWQGDQLEMVSNPIYFNTSQ